MGRKPKPGRKRVRQQEEKPYVPPPKEPPRFKVEPMCHNCGETISRDQDGQKCPKCGRLIRFEE